MDFIGSQFRANAQALDKFLRMWIFLVLISGQMLTHLDFVGSYLWSNNYTSYILLALASGQMPRRWANV
jgi:hypothetical protein